MGFVGAIHAFSFGGGVQSTAALVLAAQGKLPATDTSFRWDVFLFSNVGENAEHPATLAYVNEVAKPFARENGIDLVEVRRRRRDGSPRDLYDDMVDTDIKSIGIPVRMSNGAPGTRRCTVDYKIKAIGKELRARGASKEEPCIMGLGISVDEIQRAKHWGIVDPRQPYQIKEYPFLRLNFRREDCLRAIADAGLPQPPRSACWFCPFHSPDEWRRLRREEPDLFDRAVKLEKLLNERRESLGKDNVWLTRYAKPIDQVVQDQLIIDGIGAEGECDSGHCFV